MRALLCSTMVLSLVLAGCGDDDGTTPPVDAGGGTDGGGGTDAGGRRDAGGRPDAGPSDPCAADNMSASSTAGCNGGLLGPQPDNQFGGQCTPGDDMTPEGSCTGAAAYCWGDTTVAPGGVCLVPCTPGDTYVSTSDCPTGSRCFTLDAAGGVALCFPDCMGPTDCSGGTCDGEASCVGGGDGPATSDGGVPDAGVATDAGTADDAGAAAVDAGAAAVDAGG